MGRLQIGWTLEDAVDYGFRIPLKSRYKSLSPDKTISQLAREHNLDNKKVFERLDRGWSLDEALEIKKDKDLVVVLMAL